MMKIVVLGSKGFIGSEIVRSLNEDIYQSYEVIPLDQDQCDIMDKGSLISMISKHNPDYLINCAGMLSKDFNDRYQLFNVNFYGVKNLLDIAFELGYKGNIILFGSSEMNNSRSCYGVCKKMAFDYAALMDQNTPLNIVTLVPSIIYGKTQTGNMFIPSMIQAYHVNKTFEMSSGYQQRNFVHIDDIVLAIEILINTNKDFKELGHYLPLHYPTNFTLRQVVDIFNKVTKGEISLAYGKIPMRDGEARIFENHGFISYNKIRWVPRVTLEEGLKKCLD